MGKPESVEAMFGMLLKILEFLEEHGNVPVAITAPFRARAAELKASGNAKALTAALKEVVLWSKELPPKTAKRLRRLLDSEADVAAPLESFDMVHLGRRIIDTGRISGEDEYRCVREFVERYHADPRRRRLVKKANAMLAAYEPK